LSVLALISSVLLIQLGVMSVVVAAAYWSVKGSGMAAATGLGLMAVGLRSILMFIRRWKERRRPPA
jgi:hypothetical protein